jgi:histidinol-phosphate phosphatase family protein
VGKPNTKSRAVFLDRDGTVIREKNYLRHIKDIQLIAGVVPALKKLRKHGFKLVLVTNQSGIGRGYFTEEKLLRIHDHFQEMLGKKGVRFDAIYYCPHHPDDNCACRKPKLGLVKRAKKELNIDIRASYTVGDHTNDFLLGQNMGGKGIFVLTGHGPREKEKIMASDGKLKPDYIAKNLSAAVRWIVHDSRCSAVLKNKGT